MFFWYTLGPKVKQKHFFLYYSCSRSSSGSYKMTDFSIWSEPCSATSDPNRKKAAAEFWNVQFHDHRLATCCDVATGNFNLAEATPYLDAHIYIHFSLFLFFFVCLPPLAVDRLSYSVVSNITTFSSCNQPCLISCAGRIGFESRS